MRFLDDLADTSTTRNRLPHWQQAAATCFITWRLADSIPQELMAKWKRERAEWLAKNPEPWDEALEAEYHRIFSTEIDRIMDKGHGSCVLRRPPVRAIVSGSFAKFDGSRYTIHSSVVMPNHVHLLVTPAETRKMEDTVRDWKSYSARLINREIGEGSGSLWQKDYFDRIIRDWEHFFRVANYIRRNPGKAGLQEDAFALYEASFVKRMLG
ncbi:transposase [Akkermansiaceae bacterium]|nr:transposase [Akkermansiaceae bacterium]